MGYDRLQVEQRLAAGAPSKVTSDTACACESGCASQWQERSALAVRGLRLEYLTVGWNVLEGVVAVTAALLAGSVVLLGFGIDSFIECASAFVMIWRLRHEGTPLLSADRLDTVEHRARRLVAASLFLLASYVTFDALHTLWAAEQPRFSAVGVTLVALSLVVMLWLARAKRTLAHQLGSEAMQADALQTTACWWLSVAALAGVGLNGLFGWWWADPLAALVVAAFIVREGWEAWKGQHCC